MRSRPRHGYKDSAQTRVRTTPRTAAQPVERETPHGLTHTFSAALRKKAAASVHQIKDAVAEKARRDFRHVPVFTIDPENAQDFDDALSITQRKDGLFELGIHIADVSHFVPFNSPIDKEAQLRGTSVYLVDRTVHMLPSELSSDICSLKPKEDRLTFSVVCTIDKKGVVSDVWFGKTIIHSRKRFTYKEAQQVLTTKHGVLYRELSHIQTIAKALKAERIKNGAIEFGSEEVGFTLDDDKNPVDTFVKPYYETMSMIEECMLLANRLVAAHIHQSIKRLPGLIGVYRVHDAPNGDKLHTFETLIKALGYHLRFDHGKVSSRTLEHILEQAHGTKDYDCVNMSMLRAMPKATYDYQNTGHFGLGFKYYTHFTSPIRRYPDLMVHRILAAILERKTLTKEESAHYKRLTVRTTQQEIAAQEAERDSIKEMQVRYWKGRLFAPCAGSIVGIIPHGIFVRDERTHAEGFVHVSKLPADGYVNFDQRSLSLTDGYVTFRLGDKVEFVFSKVHEERNQLEAALL